MQLPGAKILATLVVIVSLVPLIWCADERAQQISSSDKKLANQNATSSNNIPIANPNFEAAFQGECNQKAGGQNPCEHLCLDLHDGTYECSCFYGFALAVDGYSCTRPPVDQIGRLARNKTIVRANKKTTKTTKKKEIPSVVGQFALPLDQVDDSSASARRRLSSGASASTAERNENVEMTNAPTSLVVVDNIAQLKRRHFASRKLDLDSLEGNGDVEKKPSLAPFASSSSATLAPVYEIDGASGTQAFALGAHDDDDNEFNGLHGEQSATSRQRANDDDDDEEEQTQAAREQTTTTSSDEDGRTRSARDEDNPKYEGGSSEMIEFGKESITRSPNADVRPRRRRVSTRLSSLEEQDNDDDDDDDYQDQDRNHWPLMIERRVDGAMNDHKQGDQEEEEEKEQDEDNTTNNQVRRALDYDLAQLERLVGETMGDYYASVENYILQPPAFGSNRRRRQLFVAPMRRVVVDDDDDGGDQ